MVRKASFRAQDELRKIKRRKTYTHIDTDDVSIEGEPGIETPQAENRRKLIAGLPAELQIVFELTSQEYTAEEIAEILEMKVQRVRYLQRKLKTEVSRIAKKLRFKPEDLFDEP
jgi:DNA-directed RNA polymerase specialized sigma24 family protein